MSHLILPYHARHDTLAHLRGQPLFMAKSMRDVDLADAVKACKAYLPQCGEVYPEAHAVQFYAGNAVWGEMLKKFGPDDPLPDEYLKLAKSYLKAGSMIAQRLMYYLLLIISRESRHVYGSAFPMMEALHGAEYLKFNKIIRGASGSMNAKDVFLAHAPKMKLGAYADAIAWTFYKGGFSSSYGGHKWGVIADVFKGLVDGKFSPEMATDLSWALCHNGGPIFNKGMTYHTYNAHQIKTILDVQRSGQIPELVQNNATVSSHFFAPGVKEFVAKAMELFPGVWGKEVNWDKVHKAGAVQSYSTLVAAQAKSAALAGKKLFYVTPDTYVEVIERKEKAAA